MDRPPHHPLGQPCRPRGGWRNLVPSGAALRPAGADPVSIAYTDLKEKRAHTRVTVAAGGTLADYVPFYYGPRSPMLYVNWRGGVAGYDGGQEDIVHLVCALEDLVVAGNFVITDGHPITPLSTQHDTLVALDRIDWRVMRLKYWADDDTDGDRKRRRQAEFLVHRQVPVGAVRLVAGIDEPVAQRAAEALAGLVRPPGAHPTRLVLLGLRL